MFYLLYFSVFYKSANYQFYLLYIIYRIDSKLVFKNKINIL